MAVVAGALIMIMTGNMHDYQIQAKNFCSNFSNKKKLVNICVNKLLVK